MLTLKSTSENRIGISLTLLHSCIRDVKYKRVSVFIALTFNTQRKIPKKKIVHMPA